MILNRLLRKRRINLKYAIGEVTLIFIGITLSLTFDQWNQNSSWKIKEQELLLLLTESVKNDIADLEFKIKESANTLAYTDFLIKKLTSNSDFSDSISMAFSMMGYNPQFSPDKLGYNNILAEGLPIIYDKGRRSDIMQYYQRVDDNISWGQGVQKHIDEYISGRIITDFEDYNFASKGVPFDFDKLKSDRIFLNIIKNLKRLNTVSLERLESQKNHAEQFLKRLTGDDKAR